MFNFQEQKNKYKLYNLLEALSLDDFDDNGDLIGQQTQTIKDFDAFDVFLEQRILNNSDEPLNGLETTLFERINNDTIDYYTNRLQVSDTHQLQLVMQRAVKYLGMNGNYNWINTSKITALTKFFPNTFGRNAKEFNGDISKWDVSNVVYMLGTFEGCTSLRCDISNWDVSNVKYFSTASYANTNIEFKHICDGLKKKMKKLAIRSL